MKHESQSNWQQLGSLANGILRSVEEKRQKQIEFFAAENPALQYPPAAESRVQPDLPLVHDGKPLARPRSGRYSA